MVDLKRMRFKSRKSSKQSQKSSKTTSMENGELVSNSLSVFADTDNSDGAHDDMKMMAKVEQKLRDVFVSFDQDGSGSIGRQELKTMLKLLKLGSTREQEVAKELIEEFGEDGEVNFPQFLVMFLTYFADSKLKMVEPTAADLFDLFDRRGVDLIDKNDLTIIMSSLGEDVIEPEVDAMMTEAGVEPDGVITEDLFYKLLFDLGISSGTSPTCSLVRQW